MGLHLGRRRRLPPFSSVLVPEKPSVKRGHFPYDFCVQWGSCGLVPFHLPSPFPRPPRDPLLSHLALAVSRGHLIRVRYCLGHTNPMAGWHVLPRLGSWPCLWLWVSYLKNDKGFVIVL